ncbi:MAG: hypothetical protein FWG74_01610 [Planctomycetes bacterium]|nr:hypothetical protein [Planctomycetota bacterium]
MSIRGFVLGVILLALVAWCMVRETFKQTRARYELAGLSRRENELKNGLEKLRAREESLRSPVRLAAMVQEKKLPLVFLSSARPSPSAANDRQVVQARRPGTVLDEELIRVEREIRMVSLGNGPE